MKYCEHQGALPFDWNKALDSKIRLKARPDENLTTLAQSWVTCACGNQCSEIPRNADGAPEDYDLRMLGRRFLYWIDFGGWESAKHILQMIEKRVAELLVNEK